MTLGIRSKSTSFILCLVLIKDFDPAQYESPSTKASQGIMGKKLELTYPSTE